MLSDPVLRSQLDVLYRRFLTGGLTNPLDVIEQISYLLFFKILDEREQSFLPIGRRDTSPTSSFPEPDLRWSYWTRLDAAEALRHVRERVFPFVKALGGAGSSFAELMKHAEFKISRPSLLTEACRQIDALHLLGRNQDVQGDFYEHLLSKLHGAGHLGQFRTPRHIVRLMVQMVDPRPGERVCDPAAGTCGFLVNAYQHILEAHTSLDLLRRDADGFSRFPVGDKLTSTEHEFLQTEALCAYDCDAGMTMLRIGVMKLLLHGIKFPNSRCVDTLSDAYQEQDRYDVILANPPFKGIIDASSLHSSLPANAKKTELLFLYLCLRLLKEGGRGAVIVPGGVLFGSSKAYVEIRRKLVEENRLDGVVAMPAGVFQPYAGISTAILLFTKGAKTERVWFYDMGDDGFSLDDKRQKVREDDLPDILRCWEGRHEPGFMLERRLRLKTLLDQLLPLKANRSNRRTELHRLQFEEAVASEVQKEEVCAEREQAQTALEALQEQIEPAEREAIQLGRQFWVEKAQIVANRYELSVGRYRRSVPESSYYEHPTVTLDRLRQLDALIARVHEALAQSISEAAP